ncbi:outer membrane lipoprotein carrier protein LolA [Pokkaliibacter plantistimulans]|uniref:outer membrane lipoprotein carrier protein LolA n=1 Tax=Pokkaliibacter plantistimulans TaxID=1635171 RepID=UPI000D74131E|nr:outer membrane lipoprotein carrier protein LolA [Pokkaliibacter plantistimulans]
MTGLRYFWLLLLSLSPLLAQALTFTDLSRLTQTPATLSGQFQQHKYLQALDTTIDSNGQFSYRRDKEIRWQTLAPVADLLVMTPQGLSGSNTAAAMAGNTDSNPTLALVGTLFFAVMSADWQVLQQHFSLTGSEQGKEWKATLIPLDDDIRLAVQRIELQGDAYLHHLELYEVSGDQVRIEFTDLTP